MQQLHTRVGSPLRSAFLWLPVLATVAGYFIYSLNASQQAPRALTLALVALAVNAASLLAHRMRREIPLAVMVGGAWLAAAALQIGLAPLLAVILLAACAIGIGSLLTSNDDGVTGLLVGLALMTALIGWLLPFPIHHRWLYFLLALLVVVVRGPVIARLAANAGRAAHAATASSPVAALIVINIVGISATPSWLPTMQADDISYHLALPFQLQELGYYRLDVAGSIWALAPWASDAVHAMAQVIAGAEARGAVNLMWMFALYAGMWRLARMLELPPLAAWVAIALHSSLPMSSSLLAGMQTELPTSALLVGLTLLIGSSRSITAYRLASIAALAGLMLAIKLSNALLLLPLGIWMLVRTAKTIPWKALPATVLLGAWVALPSYAYSYLIAGNPILPFFNGFFQSPFFVLENWMDPAWQHPVDAALPWRMMFETSDYLTAPAGAAGFIYLFCTAGLVLALANRTYRPVAAIGIACFLLVFSQVHFIRYAQPANALLIVAALGGFVSIGLRRSIVAGGSILCALNLSMISTGYWQIKDGALDSMLRLGPVATLARFAPQRTIAAKIRAIDDGNVRVLFHKVDAHGNAELTLPALTSSWYNWTFANEANVADADASGERWRQIFAKKGINLLVVDRSKVSDGLKSALSSFVVDPALSAGPYETWRVESQPTTAALQPVQVTKDNATFRYAGIDANSDISTTAKFSCDRTDEPIVISILARMQSNESRNLISGWAVCTATGTAEGKIEARAPLGTVELLFIAWPRSPMNFRMLESNSTIEKGAMVAPVDPATKLRSRLRTAITTAKWP